MTVRLPVPVKVTFRTGLEIKLIEDPVTSELLAGVDELVGVFLVVVTMRRP
ncbi:MAG TPA: hypothetical protein VEU47_17155 [Candidatus Cybelea sp.]|nr:hypothetical protein [Candidatus Cybelea sp.]